MRRAVTFFRYPMVCSLLGGFDAATRRLSGEPTVIAQDVAGSSVNVGAFSVSDTGVLAYATATSAQWQLSWFDRNGRRISNVGQPGDYADIQLSADDRRVAVTRVESRTAVSNILTIDLASGVASPLTFEPYVNAQPIWSPDGNELVFRSQSEIPAPMFRRAASGAGRGAMILRPREALSEAGPNVFPTDWSRDGRFILFHGSFPQTGYDVWVLPMTGDRKPRPLVRTNGDDLLGRFSPDSRYVAYPQTRADDRRSMCSRSLKVTAGGRSRLMAAPNHGGAPTAMNCTSSLPIGD